MAFLRKCHFFLYPTDMNVPDRTQPPAYHTIDEISVPGIEHYTLDNGQSAYLMKGGQQSVVRLECIFQAGSWHEPLPGVSAMTMKMLVEGTRSRTSAEISRYFDQYGAFVETNSGSDRASLTVYCLAKYLSNVLTLLPELINDSTIPKKELENQLTISRQRLRVNLEKNSYLAGVAIREAIFGRTHPYGYSQTLETLDNITREQIAQFYEKHIRHRPFQVLLAGRVTEMEMALVNQFLGHQTVIVSTENGRDYQPEETKQRSVLIAKEDSLQSSIRMGRRLFTRHHPDYYPVLVLNEVLGGYFGSRLMKNIREEKGLTYGIWSSVVTYPRDGYLVIGTDVKREFTQLTLDEIRKEIRRLQQELVPPDELEVVKNYMAGAYVGALNTPFEIADRYKAILFDGLPPDMLLAHIARIRAVTPEQMLTAANTYLSEADLIEVVVG